MSSADTRLAVYGTLAPGRENHGQLAGLDGRWSPASLRGRYHPTGWGATGGYPGLVLDEAAPLVEVQLFESADLPAHWARLDAFEGAAYRRVTITVQTPEGPVQACVYVLSETPPNLGA